MTPRAIVTCLAALAALASGCDRVYRLDGGAADATVRDGGSARDARVRGDATPLACREDRDCDDGVFCNGNEGCTGGPAPVCVAGAPPCTHARACQEDPPACLGSCDADGDEARALECGGTDCDDRDPRRYPGALEVCDAAEVDEDCDPITVGIRDADFDGHIDPRCCNVDASGGRWCGADCDDTRPTACPGCMEQCNLLDDDCDMVADEGIDVFTDPSNCGLCGRVCTGMEVCVSGSCVAP